jgi:hypothetical protein
MEQYYANIDGINQGPFDVAEIKNQINEKKYQG